MITSLVPILMETHGSVKRCLKITVLQIQSQLLRLIITPELRQILSADSMIKIWVSIPTSWSIRVVAAATHLSA
jgi:hypothetical protein